MLRTDCSGETGLALHIHNTQAREPEGYRLLFHLLKGTDGSALHCDDLALSSTGGAGGGSGTGLHTTASTDAALFQPTHADVLPADHHQACSG